jgi:citronellol/citronellal dehydrogenase
MKAYDLMQDINTRGTFVVSKACIPHLKVSANPHILTLSPPLNMAPHWFQNHAAYTISKYGMSMCTLGMSAEFAAEGIAVNSLWPRTIIATAAVQNLLGGDEAMRRSRKPEILADAAYEIFGRPSREATGNFYIDDEVLAEAGITDLSPYAYVDGAELQRDIFLDE